MPATSPDEYRRIINDRDYSALIHAVCESPADDFPRLAVADWFEENRQDAPARFIRLQLEIAAELAAGAMVSAERNGRASILLSNLMRERGWEHRAGRYVDDGKSKGWIYGRVAYVWRGFFERVELPTSSFLSEAEELFAAQPVTDVLLTDKEPGQRLASGIYGHEWYWSRPTEQRASGLHVPVSGKHVLPEELCEDDNTFRPFGSRDDAIRALSRACVAYGRGLAGLPPLSIPDEPKR